MARRQHLVPLGHNCKAACLTAACHHPVWLKHHDPALMLGLGDADEHLAKRSLQLKHMLHLQQKVRVGTKKRERIASLCIQSHHERTFGDRPL